MGPAAGGLAVAAKGSRLRVHYYVQWMMIGGKFDVKTGLENDHDRCTDE
mgnify:CR=1